MADLDLSGSSRLVSLVYVEEPPKPVDAEVLRERLKKEKQEKKEKEKQREEAAKEKKKEEKKKAKEEKDTKNAPRTVTIEHIRDPPGGNENPLVDPDHLKDAEEFHVQQSQEPVLQQRPSVILRTASTDAKKAEEGGRTKKKGRIALSCCQVFCLLLLLAAALAASFYISYEVTRRMHEGAGEMPVVEADGIQHMGISQALNAEEEDEEEEISGLIPREIEPIWYNVTITINKIEEKEHFEGSLLAKFQAKIATKQIVLHSSQLAIPQRHEGWKVLIDAKDGRLVAADAQVISVSINHTEETVTLGLSDTLSAGTDFYLRLKSYSGEITYAKNGIYVSSYRTPEGENRNIIVTSCEPAFARRIVPCIDEPDRKAVWKVTIRHPSGTTAQSNEEKEGTREIESNTTETSFHETPKMSSYLLALAVSDFVYKENVSASGVPVRVWAAPHFINQADFALSVAVQMLDYFEKIFEIPYPLKKLDLIGVPDFTMGAMENWGLLVFLETNLLYDPRVHTPITRKDIAVTVAHEISHQWFGNLVTMRWWNDLWLNEAFATHAESAAIARSGLIPEMEELVHHQQQHALFADAHETSHPVSFPISSAREVEQIFDAVTYDKGGSLVRMLEDILGVEQFRKGIVHYLKKFAYANANQNEFLDAIMESLPKGTYGSDNSSFYDLKKFMRRYTKQAGFPVLTVKRPDTLHVEITQKRFKLDANAESLKTHESRYGFKWDVPLFYQINYQSQDLEWIHDGLRLPTNDTDLLILNEDSKGFYIVNYDPLGWTRIINELKSNHTIISPLSRFRLIEDAFSLADSNELPFEVAFDLISYLDEEDDAMPIMAAIEQLSRIREKVGGETGSKEIKKFIIRTLSPLYHERVNWTKLHFAGDVDTKEADLVEALIAQMWLSDDEEVSDKLLAQFNENVVGACGAENAIASTCSTVPPIVRSQVYCEGVKRGMNDEFDKVLALYNNEVLQIEKERLLTGLKCTRSTYNLKRLYHTLLGSKYDLVKGRRVDEETLLSQAHHELARRVYNEFFYENHKQLFKRYEGEAAIASVIAAAATAHNKKELAELESFLRENPELDDFKAFSKNVEEGRALLIWRKKHLQRIRDYISEHETKH